MKLLLKKIGIYFFPIIVLAIALGLGVAAGYVSVTGMAKTFPGAGITMIILMALIESGKFVGTTWLHRNSSAHSLDEPPKDLNWFGRFLYNIKSRTLNILLTIMVVIVMAITSFGIYGFLSHGYMATANELEKSNREVALIDKKIESKQESITNYEEAKNTKTIRIKTLNDQRSNLEIRLDSLYERRWWNSVKATRQQIDESNEEIKKLTQDVSAADSTIQVIRDEITKLEVEKIEVTNGSAIGEVGPLLYLSNVTGYPMDHIVNYLILVIMFVFDPLAIVLLLAANRSFDRAAKKARELSEIIEIDPNPIPPAVVPEIIEQKEASQEVVETREENKIGNTEKTQPENGDVIYEGPGDLEDINKQVQEHFEGKVNNESDEEVAEEVVEEIDEDKDKELLINTAKGKRETKYLKFLHFMYDGGTLEAGQEISSFKELKNKLRLANVRYEEKDLEDFMLICNLLKIVKTDASKRTILKDFDVARALVANI